jgi:hypothetical protein
MATAKHNKHMNFYESAPELFWNLLLGITTVAGIWLLIGTIKMFFLLR